MPASKKIITNLFKNVYNKFESIVNKPKSPSVFGEYDIVIPRNVSAKRTVPSYIPKPAYAETGKPLPSPSVAEIKDRNQIECMIQSCMFAKRILKEIKPDVIPGVTTDFLDQKIHEMIISNGVYPSPLNYKNFPKSICTSINNVICHGIPDDRPLTDGDILNIDVTIFLNGYHGDCSEMFEVGNVDEKGKDLIKATEICLYKAIEICKPNERFCNIGNIIEETANSLGYNIVSAFGGHGIGSYFHGPPEIYHCSNDFEGVMKPGMTFTIEPVLTQGIDEIAILEDDWTAVTLDHARTAQIEHTILITEDGCDILTRLD